MAVFSGTAGDDNFSYALGGDKAPGDVADTMLGFAGNDAFSPKGGNDYVDGGFGFDTIDYFDASPVFGAPPTGIVANLAAKTVTDPWGFLDIVWNVENVVGTNFADVITSNFTDTYSIALGGNDTVVSLDGNDYLVLGAGNDLAYGGAANDTILGVDGDDVAFGQDGKDRLDLDAGNDYGYGGADDDRIAGGGGNDILYGEGGDDVIDAGSGLDFIDGGFGIDTMVGGGGTDTFQVVFGQGSTNPLTPEFIGDFYGANTSVGDNQDIILFDVVGVGKLELLAGITFKFTDTAAPGTIEYIDIGSVNGPGESHLKKAVAFPL